MRHDNDTPCPRCKLKALPPLKGIENASVCSNPTCRVVVDTNGEIVGRWTVGYGEYKEKKRHVVDNKRTEVN